MSELFIAGFMLLLYVLPSVIAEWKDRKNSGAIIALNLLLGWTFVGWVAALVWAMTDDGGRNGK